jgi:hypothetical protein
MLMYYKCATKVCLYVSRLSISAIYSLNKSTIELAKPVATALGPVALAALSQLEAAHEALGSGMNKSQRSALTPELRALDEKRDADVLEIFRVCRTYLLSKDEAKKAAASTLQLFLVPYRGVARQPINTETGTLADMTAKYKAQPTLVAAATLLDLSTSCLCTSKPPTTSSTKCSIAAPPNTASAKQLPAT